MKGTENKPDWQLRSLSEAGDGKADRNVAWYCDVFARRQEGRRDGLACSEL